MQAELEENGKCLAELTEQLKKLEEEAGEIMKACQDAEVGTHLSFYFFRFLKIFTDISMHPIVVISFTKRTF